MLISVIVCTHNPRKEYLHRAFNALRLQTLPLEQWELLVIDNASNSRLSDSWNISWHPLGRHVREDKLGLTEARLRGIRESRGELLVFFDDDNVPVQDYLVQAKEIIMRHPHLGVIGAGILEPEFEVRPPSELTSRLSYLALRSVSAEIWSNNRKDDSCIPWGAGLCVTRRVANAYEQAINKLNITSILDRRGTLLFAGGDDLFSWVATVLGQGFGVFPKLRLTHLISAGRLTQRYFISLLRAHAFSHSVLNYAFWGIQPRNIGLDEYIRIAAHGFRNDLFSMRCSWSTLRGHVNATRFITTKGLCPISLSLSIDRECTSLLSEH
jgi:glycosyltransferase involved in cell wall biosynthesis